MQNLSLIDYLSKSTSAMLVEQVSASPLQRGIVLLIRLIWLLPSENLNFHLNQSPEKSIRRKISPSDSAFLAPAASLVILEVPRFSRRQKSGVPTAVSLFTPCFCIKLTLRCFRQSGKPCLLQHWPLKLFKFDPDSLTNPRDKSTPAGTVLFIQSDDKLKTQSNLSKTGPHTI